MSIIEQKIKKNASLFNSREPSDAHLENFEAKLKALHPEKERKIKFNYRNALKLAASIAILVSLSFVLFKYGNFGKQLQAADLGPEYVELKDYYSSVNQQKLAEIDALIADDEDAKILKEKAFRRISRLEENNEALKEEYIESNQDTRVFGAIVSNYRLLAKALDKVIDGINEHNHKKTNSNN